jgi:hypothetical protein
MYTKKMVVIFYLENNNNQDNFLKRPFCEVKKMMLMYHTPRYLKKSVRTVGGARVFCRIHPKKLNMDPKIIKNICSILEKFWMYNSGKFLVNSGEKNPFFAKLFFWGPIFVFWWFCDN